MKKNWDMKCYPMETVNNLSKDLQKYKYLSFTPPDYKQHSDKVESNKDYMVTREPNALQVKLYIPEISSMDLVKVVGNTSLVIDNISNKYDNYSE